MLVDAKIRSRVLLIADAVDETGLDEAFASVIDGAAARRHRRIVRRVGVGAAGLGVALLVFFGLGGTKIQTVPQMPANTAAPDVELEPAPRMSEGSGKERSSTRQTAGPKRSARQGGRKGVANDGPAGTGHDAGTVTSTGGVSVADRGSGENTTVAAEGEATRREVAEYGRSYVGVRPDPRSHCPIDGGDCVSFRVGPADGSASLHVQDRSGSLLVRVTQTDRHGRVIGEAVSFCGGTSERFPIELTAVVLSVSVHESDCGGAGSVSPSGGQVSAVFFGRMD